MLAWHSVTSHVVSAPAARSPAAFVLPGAHGAQALEATDSLAGQSVTSPEESAPRCAPAGLLLAHVHVLAVRARRCANLRKIQERPPVPREWQDMRNDLPNRLLRQQHQRAAQMH